MEIDYSLASLIIASFIAIITLIGIIWTNIQTRNSNKILETDIKNRLRPFIQIVDIRPKFVTLPNNDIITWDNYVHTNPKPIIKFVSFSGEVKNIGAVPAFEINAKWLMKDSEIKQEELEKGKEDPPFPLGVQESYPLTAPIAWNEYDNSKTKPYYNGTKIRYQVFDEIEEIGKIWKIQFNVIVTEASWIKKIDGH